MYEKLIQSSLISRGPCFRSVSKLYVPKNISFDISIKTSENAPKETCPQPQARETQAKHKSKAFMIFAIVLPFCMETKNFLHRFNLYFHYCF